MKTKQEIVENWLPRYTQRPVKDFTKYILLTNFSKYVEIFATHFHVPILGEDGEYPNDEKALEKIVKGICFDNAKRYFNL